MEQEFLMAAAFPLHISIWFIYRKYFNKKYQQLTEKELLNFEPTAPLIDHREESKLEEANSLHKSESEYSLGLNRSESVAFSLSQYGRPCFMQHSPSHVFKMIFFDNPKAIIIVGSFVMLCYHVTLDTYIRSENWSVHRRSFKGPFICESHEKLHHFRWSSDFNRSTGNEIINFGPYILSPLHQIGRNSKTRNRPKGFCCYYYFPTKSAPLRNPAVALDDPMHLRRWTGQASVPFIS